MKTKIKYLIILSIILTIPATAKAQCTYERQAELSKIASNVNFSYTYDLQTDTNGKTTPKFTMYITNITNDIYIIETYNGITITNTQEKQITYTNIPSVTYDIYSNDPNCKDEKILTKNINMPTYNQYSQEEECKKNPDFKYCQLWGDKPSSTEEFNQETKNNQTNEKQTTKIDTKTKIITFLNQNKIWITFTIISLMVVIAYFTFIKKRIYRRC